MVSIFNFIYNLIITYKTIQYFIKVLFIITKQIIKQFNNIIKKKLIKYCTHDIELPTIPFYDLVFIYTYCCILVSLGG